MSKNNQSHGDGLIESLMGRCASDAPGVAADTTPLDARLIWRRDQDRQLNRRLDQLQSALGSDKPPQAATATPLSPRLAVPNGAGLVSSSRRYGSGVLFMTALVSAVSGAGLTWRLMGDADHGRVPGPQAVLAPAAPVAPVGPVAPVAEVVSTLAPAAPAVALPSAVDESESRARERIEHWRQAWSRRDVSAYLESYSPHFVPADGQRRSAWDAARRKQLSSRSDILVSVTALHLERVGADQIKASFLQEYASGSYRESPRPKTLLLARSGDDWQIAQEQSGQPTPR